MEKQKTPYDYSDIDREDFDATYSPEDNKLRITCSYRFDDDLRAEFKNQGFRWAPKQELWFNPSWTPQAESFCLKLAGTIEPEQSTMIDRAEAKVDRLENLADKRGEQSNAYAKAASQIGERFYGGQPILVGHHSERKARKDHEKMDNAMRKSIECAKAVDYWNYKAAGVACHANHKADPGVRARRIKTLLADLRTWQRRINDANIGFKQWTVLVSKEGAEDYEAMIIHHLNYLESAPWGLWGDVDRGKLTAKEAALRALECNENKVNSPYYLRWVSHILNRLGYEYSELGPVEKFEGEITITIVQGFARAHGTHGPCSSKTDKGYSLTSKAPLPLHLANGKSLDLDLDGWRDLMQSVGYTVPDAKPKAPPILNFKAETLIQAGGRYRWEKPAIYLQIEMTKAEYKKLNGFICLSTCGQFRFRLGYEGIGCNAIRKAVFLTDSKVHPAPESEAINQKIEAVEA